MVIDTANATCGRMAKVIHVAVALRVIRPSQPLRLRFNRDVNENIQNISTSVNGVTSRFFWFNTRKIQNIQK